MALIKCVECEKEFSDRAVACPNCGCPTEFSLEDIKAFKEKEHIENEKQLEMERILREEEAKRKKEEKEAELKRQVEEKKRKENEEEQLKKAYEEKEAYNQEIVMSFSLFGSDLTVARGMRNKVNFYRESKKNKKSYIKQFEKVIQKIQNMNDVYDMGMTKFNDCIDGYVDKQCDILNLFEDIDLEFLTSILINESEAIVERIIEMQLGEFMEDFRRMQGPSPEDTELWTREKYRVFNKYPIKDMLLKCLENIFEEIQQVMLKELAKQGLFVEWKPKQLESVRLAHQECLQRYKNANFSLSELRKKIVEVLSIDTYNQQHYQDILNLNLLGGEKTNFIKICDFLGFNEIYKNYQFQDEETYIKELELARDYLYGRGISKDIDRAKELLEKNRQYFQDDKSFLEELSVAYEKSGDGNYKLTLLERCKLGDIYAARKIFSEVLDKEDLIEQVNLYSQIKKCFQMEDFSNTYNKIFNQVKNDIEDVTIKIQCFEKLGEPTNSNDLYYVAKIFEKTELTRLWETAALYYLFAANNNHVNSIFKVFSIVENGLLDISHNKNEIVMKTVLLNDYKRIVGFIRQLSNKGNLYAKYLYATYVCANYTMKNYKMPYIFVDNPEAEVELFFSEYYMILKQAEEWLKEGVDKETENILHTTKTDIVVTVAKYFYNGPAGTVMSESARRRLDKKYSTISERRHMASKIQDICKNEGKVSIIIDAFIEETYKYKRYNYENNYYCDLFEIYSCYFGETLKYYAVSPFGDVILDTSISNFLNDVKKNWNDIAYGKTLSVEESTAMGSIKYREYLSEQYEESSTDSKYKNKAARLLYNKYRCQFKLNGCNFSYKIYGKQTMGSIVRKEKIVIEIQNNNILDEPITFKYVGNCVLAKEKEKAYFFIDEAFKAYNSLEEILKLKCFKTKIICSHCNTVLDLNMDFCVNCGEKMNNKKEVIIIEPENFELMIQVLKEKEYTRFKKMIGSNANICTQYNDGRIDWILNQVIVQVMDKELVKDLIELGADCNSVRDIETKNGICKNSALADALIYAKNFELVKLLVEKGADINFHSIHDSDISCDIPLLNLSVSKSKDYDTIRYLWDKCEDKKDAVMCFYRRNEKNKSTYLSLLFNAIEYSGDSKVVQLFLDNGYNPNEIRHDECNIPNKEVPALNAAILLGNSSIVEMLLKYGANPNSYRIVHEIGGDQKYSALADAMITNNDRSIDMLLNAGANLDEWVLYKDKMINLQKYPLKKIKLSTMTIENLKRHGWKPSLFSF